LGVISPGQIKLDIDELNHGIDASGLHVLTVGRDHAALVARLPPHHRDPFERLLVAQAFEQGFTLLTRDANVANYSNMLMA
jgi:PIN domain nuclease of toxin-antitoxin system